ncbi:Hypothetical predicted protein, partial [Paramuricea clavata]
VITAKRRYYQNKLNEFKDDSKEAEEVLKLLKKLDISKATGLDNISNKILKIAAPLEISKDQYLFCLVTAFNYLKKVKSGVPQDDTNMKKDLEHLESWLIANKLTLNTVETEYMVVGSKQRINSLVGWEKLSERRQKCKA